eukprot:m.60121 g.60121  ORF g.60121 m.60121 type:complete len:256 (+) comp9493_c0_seq4:1828-2595(+)
MGFPKSFWDPVKQRRLQYGWVQGRGLVGEEDSTLGPNLTLKNNHQSLLRQVTYDPRLGMLLFTPIDELALLRQGSLASVSTPMTLNASTHISIGDSNHTAGGVGNQSEIVVQFELPADNATFGVRMMQDSSGGGFDLTFSFTRPQNAAQGWAIEMSMGTSTAWLPLLASDRSLNVTVFVDQTVVEAFAMGGRVAMTQHVPPSLLMPVFGMHNGGGNTHQTAAVFATTGRVTIQGLWMWRMGDIWDVVTHGRPRGK